MAVFAVSITVLACTTLFLDQDTMARGDNFSEKNYSKYGQIVDEIVNKKTDKSTSR